MPPALALLALLLAPLGTAAIVTAPPAAERPSAGSPSVGGTPAASTSVGGTPADGTAPAGDPAVAVASSLRALWPRLEGAWHESLPEVDVRATFGASQTLARQIARGAPFELLLAADEVSLAELPASRTDPATSAPYAVGRLALLLREPADGDGSPEDAATPVAARDPGPGAGPATESGAESATQSATQSGAEPDALALLGARLDADPTLRLAIANPRHAPYGRAAREALASVGRWPLPPARLVTGENAAQTLQFVQAGAVDAALVPYSLVAAGAPPGTRVVLVDADTHAPLVHRLVAVRDASPAARALAAWLLGDAARTLFAEGGFDAPPAAR